MFLSLIAFLIGSLFGVIFLYVLPNRVKLAVKETITIFSLKTHSWIVRKTGCDSTVHYNLSRPSYIGPSKKGYGESNDERLLSCFHQEAWKELRKKSIKEQWKIAFSNQESFFKSTKVHRKNLKKYLGKWHSDDFDILDQETVETGISSSQITHVLLKSGIPNLVFDAFIVIPSKQTKFSKIGVITLHGHESSAKKFNEN